MLKSLNIGKVLSLGDPNAKDGLNKAYKSAIIKNGVSGRVYCDLLGFSGDMVADTVHHGGKDKAVFANAVSNYCYYEEFLGLKNMPLGGMGENLSISGIDEHDVCVGDVHEIGTLVLEVSQPRKPCFKLSKRWGRADFSKEIFRTGRTGWYYRVIKAGECAAGDELKIISKNSKGLSIAALNAEFYSPKDDNVLQKAARLEEAGILAGEWVKSISARLKNSYDDAYMSSL